MASTTRTDPYVEAIKERDRKIARGELRRVGAPQTVPEAKLQRFQNDMTEALARMLHGRVDPAAEPLERAAVHTTTADVPGLLVAPAGVSPSVAEFVANRQRVNIAFLAAIRTGDLPTGGKPWVATPAPPPPFGGPITAEKTDFPNSTGDVPGAYEDPASIGYAMDFSSQVILYAHDPAVAIVAEIVVAHTAAYVMGEIDAGASATASLEAALASVSASGYSPSLLLGPVGAFTSGGMVAGLEFVPAPTASTYVVGASGITCLIGAPDLLERDLPNTGDHEVGIVRGVVFLAAAGAIARVDPVGATTTRRAKT